MSSSCKTASADVLLTCSKVVSFLAFFEEVGWRAWLLPRLANRMNSRRAVVVTAIIWALWHVPFELSGTLHIDGVSPMRVALTVPFGTTAAGLILGWLWLRTEKHLAGRHRSWRLEQLGPIRVQVHE